MGVVAADLAESRNLSAPLISTDLEKSARGNEEITETAPRVFRGEFAEKRALASVFKCLN